MTARPWWKACRARRCASSAASLELIPAGLSFAGWQSPRFLTSVSYFHIDPAAPLLDPALRFAERALRPRLFFEDAALWATGQAQGADRRCRPPGRALRRGAERGAAARADAGGCRGRAERAGGPGRPRPWQQKRVTDYIEEHVADELSLATLAALARLSPFHFARAFKQTLGTPPHRYHTGRRIERAKSLLAADELSVTEIALEVGFGETSSFTAAFRRLTGRTPSSFRRALL